MSSAGSGQRTGQPCGGRSCCRISLSCRVALGCGGGGAASRRLPGRAAVGGSSHRRRGVSGHEGPFHRWTARGWRGCLSPAGSRPLSSPPSRPGLRACAHQRLPAGLGSWGLGSAWDQTGPQERRSPAGTLETPTSRVGTTEATEDAHRGPDGIRSQLGLSRCQARPPARAEARGPGCSWTGWAGGAGRPPWRAGSGPRCRPGWAGRGHGRGQQEAPALPAGAAVGRSGTLPSRAPGGHRPGLVGLVKARLCAPATTSCVIVPAPPRPLGQCQGAVQAGCRRALAPRPPCAGRGALWEGSGVAATPGGQGAGPACSPRRPRALSRPQ